MAEDQGQEFTAGVEPEVLVLVFPQGQNATRIIQQVLPYCAVSIVAMNGRAVVWILIAQLQEEGAGLRGTEQELCAEARWGLEQGNQCVCLGRGLGRAPGLFPCVFHEPNRLSIAPNRPVQVDQAFAAAQFGQRARGRWFLDDGIKSAEGVFGRYSVALIREMAREVTIRQDGNTSQELMVDGGFEDGGEGVGLEGRTIETIGRNVAEKPQIPETILLHEEGIVSEIRPVQREISDGANELVLLVVAVCLAAGDSCPHDQREEQSASHRERSQWIKRRGAAVARAVGAFDLC